MQGGQTGLITQLASRSDWLGFKAQTPLTTPACVECAETTTAEVFKHATLPEGSRAGEDDMLEISSVWRRPDERAKEEC